MYSLLCSIPTDFGQLHLLHHLQITFGHRNFWQWFIHLVADLLQSQIRCRLHHKYTIRISLVHLEIQSMCKRGHGRDLKWVRQKVSSKYRGFVQELNQRVLLLGFHTNRSEHRAHHLKAELIQTPRVMSQKAFPYHSPRKQQRPLLST